MKIGDFVRNSHHGLQRYGKIIKVLKNLKGDSWTYFDVEWVNDEKYRKTVKNIEEKSNRKYELEYYRADQLQTLNVDQTLKTLLKLKND
jgi:uncharacterized protein YifE (UPF0438 family)